MTPSTTTTLRETDDIRLNQIWRRMDESRAIGFMGQSKVLPPWGCILVDGVYLILGVEAFAYLSGIYDETASRLEGQN